MPGQTGCDVVSTALLLPQDDVTTGHGLWLGWRVFCVPVSPLWLTWAISLELGWHVPACCHPTFACCPLWGCSPGSCCCSTSLRVLPVVLPYGRLRHAVLPQGRTTDGMPGLPPRLRIPVCLHGQGSKARMVLSQAWCGAPGAACVEGLGAFGGVYVWASLAGTVCGTCRGSRCSEWGLQRAGISRNTSQNPHSTPGRGTPSPSHTSAQHLPGTHLVQGHTLSPPRAACHRVPLVSSQGVVLPAVP